MLALDEAIASSRLPEVIVNNPVMLKSATAQMLESVITIWEFRYP